jgi:hypothetical protein
MANKCFENVETTGRNQIALTKQLSADEVRGVPATIHSRILSSRPVSMKHKQKSGIQNNDVACCFAWA